MIEFVNRYGVFINSNYNRDQLTVWDGMPPNKESVWGGLPPTKETAMNFGNVFSGAYDTDLSRENLKFMYYYLGATKLINSYGADYDLNKLCWKRTFISQDHLKEFLDNLSNKQDVESATEPFTRFVFIKRKTC